MAKAKDVIGNPMKPLYVDLDATLIHSDDTAIYPRPGAAEFLCRLAGHGDVYILSHATLPHVHRALPYLGRGSEYLSGLFSREDLQPVIDQLDSLTSTTLPKADLKRLRASIPPLFPAGVIFDDQPVGSDPYFMKSTALGIGGDLWIQVPAYTRVNLNDNALEQAYKKFYRRFVGVNA